jgi:NADP-dependent 3-hydroxy acid dehydrogenase YdfG
MRVEQGLTAAVTGAASGIGKALAAAFAERGVSLLLMDVEGGPLRLVERAVSEAGVGVLSVETDVRVAASVSAAARAGLSRFGRIDIICNNAGVVGPWLPIWEQRIADWKWLHEVNLMGVINGISAFVPAMVERNSGHVVNTASINALSPLSIGGNAPYAASKAGVLAVSETLRTDLDRHAPAVGVTVLCPGPVTSRIRESERTRPPDLSAPAFDSRVLPEVDFGYPRISAESVAAQTLAAIENGWLFLLPNAGSGAGVQARIREVLANSG